MTFYCNTPEIKIKINVPYLVWKPLFINLMGIALEHIEAIKIIAVTYQHYQRDRDSD